MKAVRLIIRIIKYVFIAALSVAMLMNIIGIGKKLILQERIPLVFGLGNAVVITGSMAPAILPGDIIIIQSQQKYESGDIIAFLPDGPSGSPVTHRIVEKTSDGYITQGDANNSRDPEIEQSQIIGKMIWIIPQAGDIILFFQSPLGMIIIMLAGFFIICAPEFIRKTRPGEEIS